MMCAFLTSDVIETDEDPSRMQDQLLIIPSYGWLRSEAERLVPRVVGAPAKEACSRLR